MTPPREKTQDRCTLEDDSKAIEARRHALQIALREHGLRTSDLARLAGLPSPNGLYNYLNGRTRSLKTATWALLLPHLPRANPQLLMGLIQHTATPYENENYPTEAETVLTTTQEFTVQLVVVHLIELKDDLHRLRQKLNEWTFGIEGLESWLTSLTDQLPFQTRRMLKAMAKRKRRPTKLFAQDAYPE